MTEGAAVGDAKRVVRSRMREVRASIAADPADRARRSASICDRLIASVAQRRRASEQLHVLVFEPLPGEPDLAVFCAWCSANGVATYRPVVAGDALLVEPGSVDPTVLDVVVVPGLAFTSRGDRLGQGGGHFDRFLTGVREDCLRIGVAFHEQVVAALPIADHDVPVDVVITD